MADHDQPRLRIAEPGVVEVTQAGAASPLMVVTEAAVIRPDRTEALTALASEIGVPPSQLVDHFEAAITGLDLALREADGQAWRDAMNRNQFHMRYAMSESARGVIVAEALEGAIDSFSPSDSAEQNAAIRHRLVARSAQLARAVAGGNVGESVAYRLVAHQIWRDSRNAGRAEERIAAAGAAHIDYESVSSAASRARDMPLRPLGERMTRVFALRDISPSQAAVWLHIVGMDDHVTGTSEPFAVTRFARSLGNAFDNARAAEANLDNQPHTGISSDDVRTIVAHHAELFDATFASESWLRFLRAEFPARMDLAAHERTMDGRIEFASDELKERVREARDVLAAAGVRGAVEVDFEALSPGRFQDLRLVVEVTPETTAETGRALARAIVGAVEDTSVTPESAPPSRRTWTRRTWEGAGAKATRARESFLLLIDPDLATDRLTAVAADITNRQAQQVSGVVVDLPSGELVNVLAVGPALARRLSLPEGTNAGEVTTIPAGALAAAVGPVRGTDHAAEAGR